MMNFKTAGLRDKAFFFFKELICSNNNNNNWEICENNNKTNLSNFDPECEQMTQ